MFFYLDLAPYCEVAMAQIKICSPGTNFVLDFYSNNSFVDHHLRIEPRHAPAPSKNLKGQVAWDISTLVFLMNQQALGYDLSVNIQLSDFLQIQWVIGEFRFTSRVLNAGSYYFPRLYMRQVITCRIYKHGK